MALFGRNTFDELDNDYIPLEEFAPTLSKQEVVKRRKLSDLITPIRDIPLALRGRRNQIEKDLNAFCIDQDEDFEQLTDDFLDMIEKQKGHIEDVGTLLKTMEQVRGAAEAVSAAIEEEPESPEQRSFMAEIDIPTINLKNLAEEYMPDQDIVEQIRSYSSFSHILKKSTEYAVSAINQYHEQVKNLSDKQKELSDLAAAADLLALHATIDATHMSEESREFSTKIAGEISDLSRKIHELSASLDAELGVLENGFKSVHSSMHTIESAHRDCTKYMDMYSSNCNEYYRQSTNYTNILISSLSTLNQEFREALKKKDSATKDYLKAFNSFCKKISKNYKQINSKNEGLKSVMDGCIRGASSLSEEMETTMELISEVRESLIAIRKTDSIRKDKYSKALLKAFDQDLVWLSNKIESTFDKAEESD
ncbi:MULTISPECIES: hypothetical protein [unclassified Butyrivibrio]|uniref:hypothetical protein n=1 Tax=unclassified Butyrivibrio TaxID=2639466 RepID=UPI00040ACB15|nr:MULTISPECIES: hypothetical protein [unclassified Butyrivibrio]